MGRAHAIRRQSLALHPMYNKSIQKERKILSGSGRCAPACMRMRVRSAGVPTSAPRPPAVRPQRAFWYRGSGLPSFALIASLLMICEHTGRNEILNAASAGGQIQPRLKPSLTDIRRPQSRETTVCVFLLYLGRGPIEIETTSKAGDPFIPGSEEATSIKPKGAPTCTRPKARRMCRKMWHVR